MKKFFSKIGTALLGFGKRVAGGFVKFGKGFVNFFKKVPSGFVKFCLGVAHLTVKVAKWFVSLCVDIAMWFAKVGKMIGKGCAAFGKGFWAKCVVIGKKIAKGFWAFIGFCRVFPRNFVWFWKAFGLTIYNFFRNLPQNFRTMTKDKFVNCVVGTGAVVVWCMPVFVVVYVLTWFLTR